MKLEFGMSEWKIPYHWCCNTESGKAKKEINAKNV